MKQCFWIPFPFACAALLATSVSLLGANKTWDGDAAPNLSWQIPSNWNANTLPSFSGPVGDNVTISGDNVGGMTLDGSVRINSLTISTLSGATLAAGSPAGTLTVTSGQITRGDLAGNEAAHSISANIVLGAGGVITNNASTASGNNFTISGAISDGGGNYGLLITGSSNRHTYLNGDNRYGGTTTINMSGAGTVYMGGQQQGTGSVVLTAGNVDVGGLATSGGTITVNGGTMTINGVGTTSGNVTINSGMLAVSAGRAATQSGTLTMKGGTLSIADMSGLPGSGTFSMGGSGTGVSSNVQLTLASAGMDFSRNLSILSGNSGTATILSAAGGTISGNIGLSRSLILDASASTLTVSGAISDASGANTVTKGPGAGNVVLSGANSYSGSGGTQIQGGMLAGNVPAGNLNLAGGIWGASGTFHRTLGTGAANVCWSAGKAGGFAAYGGPLRVDLNTSGSRDKLTWETTGNFIGNAILLLNSTIATDRVEIYDNIDLGARDRVITVDDNPTLSTDYAEISGNITYTTTNRSITKSGAGKLVLSGNNSYLNTTFTTGTLGAGSSSAFGSGKVIAGVGVTFTAEGGSRNLSNALSLVGNVNFTGNYDLSLGGDLTQAASGRVNVSAGITAGVGHVASPTARSLTKDGPGTLSLGGSSASANSVANVAVAQGTLVLNHAGGGLAIPNTAAMTIGVNGGAGVGAVRLAQDNQIGTGAITIYQGSTLDFEGRCNAVLGNISIFDGVLCGAGDLSAAGIGLTGGSLDAGGSIAISSDLTATAGSTVTAGDSVSVGGTLVVGHSAVNAAQITAAGLTLDEGVINLADGAGELNLNGPLCLESSAIGSQINGRLALGSASVLSFHLANPAAWQGLETRELVLDGVMRLSDSGGADAGVYRLMTYSRTLVADNGLTLDLSELTLANGPEMAMGVPLWRYLEQFSGLEQSAGTVDVRIQGHRGDANLDGLVDVGDLGILATNYGREQGAGWRLGDFNLDGLVDVGDLGLLATHYGWRWDQDPLFPGGAGAGPGAVAVAEPMTMAMLGVSACAILRRGRRSLRLPPGRRRPC